jgi:MFS transporter, putative metabolite:H+ symporter
VTPRPVPVPTTPQSAGQIAARLDRLPMSRTLWRLVLLISLGGACELYDLFLTAYIGPGLVTSGLFTNHTVGLFAINGVGFFVFSNFAGMLLGCMFFGYVADRFGRRTIFISSLLWYSVATAIMAFQSTAFGVDLWRLIAGIGIGLEQVTIDTLLPEFVPPQSRGRAFAFYQFVEFCVVPVVALLGWLLVPRHPWGLDGWRWVTLVGSVGAIFAWWLRRGIPESPRWLAVHGRGAEADAIVSQLEESATRDTGAPLPSPAPPPPSEARTSSFSEIFRPPYGGRTLMLSIFNLMQTIAFYGFGSWVPTLLVAKGIQITTSLQYAFIIAIANPVGPLLGMLVADRMERKWQIVSAGLGIGIFMFLFAVQSNPALIIFLGVLVTLSNNWMSFAFHNYQAELFPTRVRARAVGFVYGWSRVSAAFAGLLIGFFLQEGGAKGVALFIGAAMAVMTVTIGGFGPKTKNLGLEEISH